LTCHYQQRVEPQLTRLSDGPRTQKCPARCA
jgi:hypothetical protein